VCLQTAAPRNAAVSGPGRTLDSLPVATHTSELLVSAVTDVRDELDLRTERLATALSVPDKMLVELQLLIDEVPDDKLRTALLEHLDRVAPFSDRLSPRPG